MIKVLFIGTSEFAVPSLESLLNDDNVEVVGVVTQPDRPQGRHHSKLVPSAVKEYSLEYAPGIKIFQPERLKAVSAEILEETNPDLVVVASYGQMVPRDMLDTPKYKCLNVHGSILPELRGAVPISMAILQGLERTGVTIQRMVKALDAGPIVSTEEVKISLEDTTESLTQKLAGVGAKLLVDTIPDWVAGNLEAKPQDESRATFCYQSDIPKDNAQVTSDMKVEEVNRMVRAFYPWPVAWGFIKANGQKKRIKIFRINDQLNNETIEQLQGIGSGDKDKLLDIQKLESRLFLRLSDGWIELLELQLEGKERRSADSYLFLI